MSIPTNIFFSFPEMMEQDQFLNLTDLQFLTKKYLDNSSRKEVTEDELLRITRTLANSDRSDDEKDYEVMTECLRCLRNAVAGQESNQSLVASQLFTSSSSSLHELMSRLTLHPSTEKSIVALRVSLQLVYNLITDNRDSQLLFLENTSLLSTLKTILSNISDDKCKKFGSLILQNFLEDHEYFENLSPEFSFRMSEFIPVMAALYQDEEDCSKKCLEYLLSSHVYLQHLTREERVACVDIIPFPPDEEIIQLLMSDFTYLTDVHLLTHNNSSSVSSVLEASHVLALTHFLSTCSGHVSLQSVMQSNKSLVINTTYLLKMVHQSAATDQDLTVLNKLSDVLDLDKDDSKTKITDSPTFGFKECLIELLTNLVWDHHENQTLVGELSGVALLMDCSQIDARNPFITQRVILAIKALTTNHQENQKVLAGMKKLGAADSSLLSELGLYRDSDGNIKKVER